MKRVKTLILSLIVIFASAFISACSCSFDDDVEQIYETGISIRCLNDEIENDLDLESGLLTIKCHKGDTFKIEYTLTPSNATTTQVDWEFDVEGVVESKVYTYSKSTCEIVSFTASRKGNTTLTFKTKATSKKAVAKIQVYDADVNLPNFVAPSNISYDPMQGLISWDNVSKVVYSTGNKANITTSDGEIVGLSSYKIDVTDLETLETTTHYPAKLTDNYISIEKANIEIGKAYSIQVTAIGDGYNVKDSEASTEFKFCQLKTATELKNNNGQISFVTPELSDTNRVYYSESDSTKYEAPTTTANTLYEMNYTEFSGYENLSKYVVRVQSFPKDYNNSLGYSVDKDGIRYYPSLMTDSLTIQKLVAPNVTLVNNKDSFSLEGIVFTSDNKDDRPHISSQLTWNMGDTIYDYIYDVKYVYEVKKDNVVIATGKTTNLYYDLKNLSDAGIYTVSVYTEGNSENTISSPSTSFDVTLLDKIDKDTTTVINNVLTTSSAGIGIYGVELYFINVIGNTVNEASSQRMFVSANGSNCVSIDLSALALNAGTYKIYGRNIGMYNADYSSATYAGELEEITNSSITILDTVAYDYILYSGEIKFTEVANASAYQFLITQNKKVGSTSNEPIALTYDAGDFTFVADSQGRKMGSISIFDMVKEILDSQLQSSTDIDVDLFLDNTNIINYQIIALGDGSDRIASSATKAVKFDRLVGASDVQLKNYVITFTPDASARQYVIKVNGHETSELTPIYSSGKVTFNLNNLYAKDGNPLADYISKDDKTLISVISIGNNGDAVNKGSINSPELQVYFDITSVPTNISLDLEGNLTWESSNLYDSENEKYSYDNETYRIRFYNASTGEPLMNEGSEIISIVTPTITYDDSDSSKITNIECITNINEILQASENQIIGITIEELHSSKFYGSASEMYYVSKLGQVSASYSSQDGTPRVSWEALEGADYYDIKINDELKITDLAEIYYEIPAEEWGKGTYILSIMAKGDNSGANSISNPFVLYGNPEVISVTIVDKGDIVASVNGTDIVWNSICENSTYDVKYKKASASEFIVAYVAESTTFDASNFDSGLYVVVIEPSVDYEATGYIIIGTSESYNFSRLAQPDNLSTENGLFVFYAYNDNIESIELYTYNAKSGEYQLVNSSLYTYTSEPIVEEGSFKYTLFLERLTSGDLKIKVKVKTAGCLDSKISDEKEVTKITTVTDLAKIGDWLSWTATKGISEYLINYGEAFSDTINSLTVYVEEQSDNSYIAKIKEIVEVDGTQEEVIRENTDIFKYENGKFYYKFSESQFIDSEVSGDYKFTVKPMTDKTDYLNGNTSNAMIITKLNNDISVTITDGKINISGYVVDANNEPLQITYTIKYYTLEDQTIEGEEGSEPTVQQVKVYGDEYTDTFAFSTDAITIDLIEKGLSKDGTYEIFIQYLGDGNQILDSNVFNKDGIEKLIKTSVSTQNGVVTWGDDTAPDSAKYLVKITGVFKVYTTESLLFGTEQTLTKIYVVSGKELIDNQTYSIYGTTTSEKLNFMNGTEYKIQVQVTNDGYISSEWSDTFTVKKLYAPNNITIETTGEKLTYNVYDGEGNIIETVTINVGDPILKWQDNNVSALKFNYQLKYTDNNIVDIYNTGELSYQYILKDLAVNTYGLALRIVGNTSTGTNNIGYLTSDYSTPVSVNYISDVSTVAVKNGIVEWNSINGAYAYKVSAYEKTDYINAPETATPIFQTYTSSTSFNFTNSNIANMTEYYGNFVIVINAITDPTKAIVSLNKEIVQSNTATVYKPKTLEEYKVKDGMLSWTISINTISEFLNSYKDDEGNSLINIPTDLTDTTPLDYVLDYIVTKINLGQEGDSLLDDQLSFIYKIKLNINGVVIEDLPSAVNVVNDNGTVIGTGYSTNGTKLEFLYDISIAPEIDLPTTDEEGEESEDAQLPEDTIVLASNYNTAGISYEAGYYNVKIASIGNSNTSVSVVDNNYTGVLKTYKPITPRAWIKDGADMVDGNLLWELVTTEKSTTENKDFYPDYRINAEGTEVGISGASVDVTIKQENVYDTYKYSEYVKNLFVTENGTTNVISYNTYYKLMIKTRGTADSATHQGRFSTDSEVSLYSLSDGNYVEQEKLTNDMGTLSIHNYDTNKAYTKVSFTKAEDESVVTGYVLTSEIEMDILYLNSNTYVFSDIMNILKPATSIKAEAHISQNKDWANMGIQENQLTWSPSNGSKATNIYVYGPFNNLTTDNSYNSIWTQEILDISSLEFLTDDEKALIEPLNLTVEDLIERAEYLRGINPNYQGVWEGSSWSTDADTLELQKELIIKIVDNFKQTETVSYDEVNEDLFKFNLTNNSNYLAGGYIIRTQEIGDGRGIVDSVISETLIVNKLESVTQKDGSWLGTGNRIGMFVWNPVNLANAYRIDLYQRLKSSGESQLVHTSYTRETYYDLPSNSNLNADYETYEYYIEITACYTNDNFILIPNYFSSDIVMTAAFGRLAIPTNLTIMGDGTVTWDKGANIVGSYQLSVNSTPQSTLITRNETDLSTSASGTIEIAVRAIPTYSAQYLNSSYCAPVTVTKVQDPNPRVEDGVFFWGTEGDSISKGSVTDTELTIDDVTQTVDKSITSLKYYTELENYDENYKASQDEQLYTADSHNFKVKFKGTEGTSVSTTDEFYIASSVVEFDAIKLPVPIISNVELDVSDGTSENRVKWTAVENASGYRIVVFVKQGEDSYERLEYCSLVIDDTAWFEMDGSTYYFRLKDIISKHSSNSGMSLYIYCQAVGTEDSSKLESGANNYISSSYSESIAITIPPTPTNVSYSYDTGKLSWEMESTDAFNIMILTSYNVDNVTTDELNNYWIASSDAYGSDVLQDNVNKTINPYSEIKYRKVEYTLKSEGIYTLSVTDTIMLYSQDNNYSTPTSYSLTSIGYNYLFTLVATTSANVNYAGDYKSNPTTFGGTEKFDLFERGDGSEYFPYEIVTQTSLNKIRYFKSRHFVLNNDIDLVLTSESSSWNTILGNFTGSIDGQNYTISNLVGIIEKSNGVDTMAFVENNMGTIKNLNLNITMTKTSGAYTQIKVAGLAINNSGTIENVHINGVINISINQCSTGHEIGGLAVISSGTIKNSSFKGTITGLDDSGNSTYVGGIVRDNTGLIQNCYFGNRDENTSSIKGNYVGGIACRNRGTIDRCYTSGTMYLTDSCSSDTVTTKKIAVGGGVVAVMSDGDSISMVSNCYSLMRVVITKANSSNYTNVGALIGQFRITDNSKDTIDIYVKNSYAIVSYSLTSSISNGSLYAYYLMPSSQNIDSDNITNNYYIEDNNSCSSMQANTWSGCTKVETLTALKNALSALKENDKYIYNTSVEDEYPIFATV